MIKIALSKILSNLMLLEGRLRWMACGRTEYIILPNGLRLYFDWDERVNVFGYVKTVWDYHVYGNIPNGGVVVDAGSSIGVYALKAAEKAETIYAIEPEPNNFAYLEKNISANSLTNIEPLNFALAHYDGIADLYLTSQFLGKGHEVHPRHHPNAKISVECRKFDTLFSGISEIDTVKIDIEGYEMPMLVGAKNFLREGGIKNLSIASYHYKSQEKEVMDFLRNFGYKVWSKFFLDGDIIVYARLKR